MHIHAMWQMGLEYCDAIVYQAKVHQAKKVYEEENAMTVEDSVKSAMSPFLVLEVRRDHLIEDTLVHVKLKVVLIIVQQLVPTILLNKLGTFLCFHCIPSLFRQLGLPLQIYNITTCFLITFRKMI